MSITPISPSFLRQYISAVSASAAPKKSTSSKKAKKETLSKEDAIDQSLSLLDGDAYLIKQPDFDPEGEMAEQRGAQAKARLDKGSFEYQPGAYSLNTTVGVTSETLRVNPYTGAKTVHIDKFTYFTLVEALIMTLFLYEDLPKGSLKLVYGVDGVNKKERRLYSYFVLKDKDKVIKKYRLSYDILKNTYTIFDWTEKETVGQLTFHLVGTDYLVEKIEGYFLQKKIYLDPVWDKKNTQKLAYQKLQIGHRKLDLTPTSKDRRVGQWSFKGVEAPLPYEAIFESSETKKDHIETKMSIKIGQRFLTLRMKFIDDCFPEPYFVEGIL